MTQGRRTSRFRAIYWPELEEEMKKWVMEMRSKRAKMSTVTIRIEARKYARANSIRNFKGTAKWCYSFMRRRGLSVRAVAHVGQSLSRNMDFASGGAVNTRNHVNQGTFTAT